MQKRNIALAILLAALLTGCFTKVEYKTRYVLKSWVKSGSDPATLLTEGVSVYAFDADTTAWDVLSYEDALAGKITSRITGETKQPLTQGEASLLDTIPCLSMTLDGPQFLILAVDTQHKLYGFTVQPIGENLPELYVNLTFLPGERGTRYLKGKWIFCNDFYGIAQPEEPEEPEESEETETPEETEEPEQPETPEEPAEPTEP